MRRTLARSAPVETRLLRYLLAGAGTMIVAGAIAGNAGSVLLAIAACLVCASRLEHNHPGGGFRIE